MAKLSIPLDDESYQQFMQYKPRWQKKAQFARDLMMRQIELLEKDKMRSWSNWLLTSKLSGVPI